MAKRIAVIGDIHGCIKELKLLVRELEEEGVDEIFHVGDLVDRGPDSLGVIDFCRRKGIRGVRGNHEWALLNSKNIGLLAKEPENEKYLRDLPRLHVDDDLRIVIVHGGLWPGLALWKQPIAVMFAQLIHPERVGDVRWWRIDKNGRTEEENYKEGYRRWWEICDEEYTVVYGHTVHEKPFIYKNTIGVDTGCVFGGALTAVILPEKRFIQIPARRVYCAKDRSL